MDRWECGGRIFSDELCRDQKTFLIVCYDTDQRVFFKEIIVGQQKTRPGNKTPGLVPGYRLLVELSFDPGKNLVEVHPCAQVETTAIDVVIHDAERPGEAGAGKFSLGWIAIPTNNRRRLIEQVLHTKAQLDILRPSDYSSPAGRDLGDVVDYYLNKKTAGPGPAVRKFECNVCF